MKSSDLNGNWKLYYRQQKNEVYTTGAELESSGILSVEATVPGNCELDLSKAGILPHDLFFGMNIQALQEYEYFEWWYVKEFDYSPKEDERRVTLFFDGVDCFADYYLNGKFLAHTENALIPHEFECGGLLKEKNELIVHIKSALLESHKYEPPVFSALYANVPRIQFQTIRKPAHSFGWDIMPRCMTSGIWRGVSLRSYGGAEIKCVYIKTMGIYEDGADVAFAWSIDCDNEYYIRDDMRFFAAVSCGDSKKERSTKAFTNTGTLHMHIPDPKLWFPRGYGEPNVYDVTVSLRAGDTVLTEKKMTFGIRTVELERTDTADGVDGKFGFIINGVQVFCTGSNWVPLDAFHSRDVSRTKDAVDLVLDSGCNILRVWGGSVYESDLFYDLCDRNGIMVWQDFCMACNIYPQTDWFFDIMKNEALSAVKRLRNHPSIILWAGDNECDETINSSGVDPSINKITREILPDIITYHDPSRPYIPSSPYISKIAFDNYKSRKQIRLDRLPENHLWGPRDYFKAPFYTNSIPCFASETGYHGCPSKKALERFISPDKFWPYEKNPEWILHSSDYNGNDARVMLMDKQVRQMFGERPNNLDDYALASQISQAEAKKYFIERMRINRPYCSGIIWWNLIDGWPELSDAVVDYYFEKKLAYTYIRRVQKPFIIMVGEINGWGSPVIASNITSEDKSGSYRIYDADTGETLSEGDFSLSANTNRQLGFIPLMYSDKRMLLIEWNADGIFGANHYLVGSPAFDLETYKRWLSLIQKQEENAK